MASRPADVQGSRTARRTTDLGQPHSGSPRGGFNFGGGGFNFSPERFGFGPDFSFGQNFDFGTLDPSFFGPHSPFTRGFSTPLQSGPPSQANLPEGVEGWSWKKFLAFLIANGPAWIRAFREGRVDPPRGARPPTQNRDEAIRRYLQEQAQQSQFGGSTLTSILLGVGLGAGALLLLNRVQET